MLTLCYNLDNYKTKKYVNKDKQTGIQTKYISKNERQEYKNLLLYIAH